MPVKWAVVGSGPAGLAAAWRLSEAGLGVCLYEGSSRLGGGLRTEEVAGRGADVVVQLFSADYSATLELLEAMGLADRVVSSPGEDAIWRKGRAHGLRYGSVPSMLASGALPTGLKLRMGLSYVPFLERHARSLDLNEPVRAARAGLDGESIADWGRQHVGEGFVEWLASPLLASYYGVTPEETGAGLFHALARAGMAVAVQGARGGFGELAHAMARVLAERGVELRAAAAVRGVEGSAGGVRVILEGAAEEHAGVVVAVPPAAAARLVPGVPLLDRVRVRSTAALVLATRRPLATGWFGLSIPRREPVGRTLAAVCVQEEKGTGVVGDTGGALVLVPTPAVGERWAGADAAAVLKEGLSALGEVLPNAPAEVEEGRLVRLEDGVWIPEAGHFSRVAAFDPDVLPGWLALAGDYLVAPTVEGAVRSGLVAADRLIARAGAG